MLTESGAWKLAGLGLAVRAQFAGSSEAATLTFDYSNPSPPSALQLTQASFSCSILRFNTLMCNKLCFLCLNLPHSSQAPWGKTGEGASHIFSSSIMVNKVSFPNSMPLGCFLVGQGSRLHLCVG